MGLPSPSGGELPRARGEVSPESAMADEGRGVCGPGVEAWAAATTSSCPLDERGGRALPQTCKIAQVYCVCEWRGACAATNASFAHVGTHLDNASQRSNDLWRGGPTTSHG